MPKFPANRKPLPSPQTHKTATDLNADVTAAGPSAGVFIAEIGKGEAHRCGDEQKADADRKAEADQNAEEVTSIVNVAHLTAGLGPLLRSMNRRLAVGVTYTTIAAALDAHMLSLLQDDLLWSEDKTPP